MAEPENHTLRLLQEFREARKETNDNFSEIRIMIDGLRDFVSGESVLARYAAKNVDERLDALEKRVSELEGRR